MTPTIIILCVVCALLIVVLLVLLLRKPKTDNTKSESELKDQINQQLLQFNNAITQMVADNNQKNAISLHDYQESVNSKLAEQFRVINDSLGKNMQDINHKVEERLTQGFNKNEETFKDIIKRMTVIDEAQKKITDLSTEVVSLQNVLTNNQKRGAWGEYQLNQILFSAFGENKRLYDTQYTFKNGDDPVRADAVIFVPEPQKMVCIDSKFPFSAYSKLFDNTAEENEEDLLKDFTGDVKKHIKAISSKYIVKDQTADYAVMFVPSDGVLALLHTKCQEVVEEAHKVGVLIVSPTTLFPLLSTYQMVYFDQERSRNIRVIIDALNKLNIDFGKLNEDWDKISKNISALSNSTQKLDTRMRALGRDFKDIHEVNIIEEEKKPAEVEESKSEEQ